MATGALVYDVDSIGNAAGWVYEFLAANGPVTLARLAKGIDAPRDLVMQGVGWLAREGKIRFEDSPRAKLVTLA